MLVVLKISGHLYTLPHKIIELMNTILMLIRDRNIDFVIVPGGSIFADTVKELQIKIGINDDAAHWMAIKAMEVYGLFLKSFIPKAIDIDNIDNIYRVINSGFIPIVMPYKILREYDNLPHSWDITSDSISIYLAHLLNANIVALGKMVDGITDSSGKILEILNIDELPLYARDIVDNYTHILAKKFRIPIAIFCITKPWLLQKIIATEYGGYTFVKP